MSIRNFMEQLGGFVFTAFFGSNEWKLLVLQYGFISPSLIYNKIFSGSSINTHPLYYRQADDII